MKKHYLLILTVFGISSMLGANPPIRYLSLQNNQASEKGIYSLVLRTASSKLLSSVSFDFTIGDAYAYEIGQYLSKNPRRFFNGYNFSGSANAIKDLFSHPFWFALAKSTFNEEQCQAMGQIVLPQTPSGYYYQNCSFQDKKDFAANLTPVNISFQGNAHPNVSTFYDEMIYQIAQKNAFSSLNINLAHSNVSSEGVNFIIEQALQANTSVTQEVLMGLFNMPNINWDELTPNIEKYMTAKNPPLSRAWFGGSNGNAEKFVNAFFSGESKNSELVNINDFHFHHGNLKKLAPETWEKMFASYSSLDLSFNQLGENIDDLVTGIGNRPKSSYFWLQLENNHIDDEGAQKLFSALITSFNQNPPKSGFLFSFGDNPLGDAGVEYLVDFLKLMAKNKYSSWVQYKFNNSSFTAQQWVMIFDALKGHNISSLAINNCRNLTSEALEHLGQLIVSSSLFWYLDMIGCSIDDDAITGLAQGLKNLTAIPYMNLNKNSVGDKGAEALAQALSQASEESSSCVSLSDNLLTSAGANSLIQAASVKRIFSLDLGKNTIFIPNILKPLKTYQGDGISLEGLNINDGQAKLLADIFKSYKHMAFLSLNDNEITDWGIMAIANLLDFSHEEPHSDAKIFRCPDFNGYNVNTDAKPFNHLTDDFTEFRRKEETAWSLCSVQ